MNVVGECVLRRAVGSSWPCGETAPPITFDLRVDGLERVVGLRQQPLVVAGGDVGAGRAELRPPEAVEVRLVADDEVVDVRQLLRERGAEGGVLRACLGRHRRRLRAPLVDGEDYPDPVELRRVGRVLQHRELVRVGSGVAGRPDRRLADDVEAGEPSQVHLRLGGHEVGRLARVLGRADEHPAAGEGGGGQRQRGERGGAERRQACHVSRRGWPQERWRSDSRG